MREEGREPGFFSNSQVTPEEKVRKVPFWSQVLGSLPAQTQILAGRACRGPGGRQRTSPHPSLRTPRRGFTPRALPRPELQRVALGCQTGTTETAWLTSPSGAGEVSAPRGSHQPQGRLVQISHITHWSSAQ